MANRFDSGEVQLEKPAKQRRFPWRLWMYAIVITGAAGGAGYFAYQYHDKAGTAEKNEAQCKKELENHDTLAKDLDQCHIDLGKATEQAKDLDAKLTEGTKNLTGTQAELAELRQQKADADKRTAAIEDIRKRFENMIKVGQLEVVARHGELVVSLPSEVLFPTGSAQLSKPGEYAVVEVAAVLKKFPDRHFLIVGHTDNQDFAKPKATPPAPGEPLPTCVPTDNWQLSTERALTVTRVMVTAGMKPENLIPAGVGEHDPVDTNATSAGRQHNRRIEIVLLPAINELPPLPPSLKDESAPKK